MSKPLTDWEAVEQIGRRLYELSLPGVPVDSEELAALGSSLVLMANVETERERTPEETEQREKADSYLLEYISEIMRGNRYASDLSDWLMQNLRPESVKRLAADWDDSQADKPADETEGKENA